MERKMDLKPCPFCGEERDFAIRRSTTILPAHEAVNAALAAQEGGMGDGV